MRKNDGRWLTWTLGVVAALAIAIGTMQYGRTKRLEIQVEAHRQRALANLVNHVESLEANAAKAIASSSSAQQVNFLVALWLDSQAARGEFSLVGADGVDTGSPRKFVAIVGDFAAVLAQKLARGDTVTTEEWQELSRLREGVKSLSSVLSETARASQGRPNAAFLPALSAALGRGSQEPISLNYGFFEMDTLSQSIPSPVYDGPFSEKNLEARALARPGPEIDEERAKEIATGFFGTQEFSSVSASTAEGVIPSYTIMCTRKDGAVASITVARQGGAVITALDPAAGRGQGSAMTLEQARERAVGFLADKGFSKLEETGWQKSQEDRGRVRFAFVPHETFGDLEVRLYPDTVKVEVSLTTGEVVSFDQTNYLLTHDHPGRHLVDPLVSEKEARTALKPDLVLGDGQPRLCVIPVLPTTEAMAWEYRVESGADAYLVYVNAMTGKEIMILKLIEDESGAMAV